MAFFDQFGQPRCQSSRSILSPSMTHQEGVEDDRGGGPGDTVDTSVQSHIGDTDGSEQGWRVVAGRSVLMSPLVKRDTTHLMPREPDQFCSKNMTETM